MDDYENNYNELMKEDWLSDAINDLCNPMTSRNENSSRNIYCDRTSRNENSSRNSTPVDTVVNPSMIDSRAVVVEEINVESSDTVVIDSDFKLFAIDYFKSGKISFLILH